jgi:hypothetical protein
VDVHFYGKGNTVIKSKLRKSQLFFVSFFLVLTMAEEAMYIWKFNPGRRIYPESTILAYVFLPVLMMRIYNTCIKLRLIVIFGYMALSMDVVR